MIPRKQRKTTWTRIYIASEPSTESRDKSASDERLLWGLGAANERAQGLINRGARLPSREGR